jgi:hypothetical protein
LTFFLRLTMCYSLLSIQDAPFATIATYQGRAHPRLKAIEVHKEGKSRPSFRIFLRGILIIFRKRLEKNCNQSYAQYR